MAYAILNGKIIDAEKEAVSLSNRSYRYGDGLFETIHICNGRMKLFNHHMERLFSGMALFKFNVPSHFIHQLLKQKILELCNLNSVGSNGRVRLTITRGDGNIMDTGGFQYSIEVTSIVTMGKSIGLRIGTYSEIKKPVNAFSNYKTCSCLNSVMGIIYAKEKGWDDCVLYNTSNHIIETTVSNIFLAKDDKILTPSLTEGCVNGVMRKHIIEWLVKKKIPILEEPITEEDLLGADEVFLTNAMGLRSVGFFAHKEYGHHYFERINYWLQHE